MHYFFLSCFLLITIFHQVIGFLKKKEDFIGQVLKHLDTSAMMDLVLRLISSVEPACLRQEVLSVSALNQLIHLYFYNGHFGSVQNKLIK